MTKLAYLECPTGIAGDMCLGAVVDAGVPLDYLTEALNRLGIAEDYRLRVERVHRNGQQATKVHVDLTPAPNGTEQAVSTLGESVPSHPHPHSATEISDSSGLEVETGTALPEQHPVSAPHHSPAHSHNHDNFFATKANFQGDRAISTSTHSHNHTHAHAHSHTHSHSQTHSSPIRHLPEIETMIRGSGLPARAEAWSLAVFRRLAEAEAAVHGIPPEQVHFHEVGATDAIVDIVGTCLGLDWLGIDRLYCSALPTGGGTVRAAHGRLPVPAPAVLKLWELRQIPIYSNGIERELVTPTGAAIATTLATQFGPPPRMTLLRVGLGAGSIDLPIPNILRLWIGEAGAEAGNAEHHLAINQRTVPEIAQPAGTEPGIEPIAVLETQIDDLSPQAIGYVFETLFAAGAVDVFTQAIGMKKSRPGVLLTVICPPAAISGCEAVLFRETTTLGIRRSLQQRRVLHRQIQSVQTPYGTIRVKVAWAHPEDARPLNVQPEYEDCAAIARQQQLPWRAVHQLALQHWQAHSS